jgi:hypothetical protein
VLKKLSCTWQGYLESGPFLGQFIGEEGMKGKEMSDEKFFCGRRSGDEKVPDMARKEC